MRRSEIAATALAGALALTLGGCGSTDFSGGGSRNAGTTAKAPETAPPPADPTAAAPEGGGGASEPSLEEGGSEQLDLPPGAVTKGSFSVWTEPADPQPWQDYDVVIQIKLPASVAAYDVTDISGILTGTDGYLQPLGRDGIGNQQFTFEAGRARLRTPVPGSYDHVQDTIDVTSSVLHESQSIKIEF